MVYEFLGLLVESYGTWLLLQRLVDSSKDSDIPKNVPFAFAINNRNITYGVVLPLKERECCLLVLNLVSSTLGTICHPLCPLCLGSVQLHSWRPELTLQSSSSSFSRSGCHEIVRSWVRTVVCSENRSVVVSLMFWRAQVLGRRVVEARADPHRHGNFAGVAYTSRFNSYLH